MHIKTAYRLLYDRIKSLRCGHWHVADVGQTVWFCPCRQQPMHSAAAPCTAQLATHALCTWIAGGGNSHFGPSPSGCEALGLSSRTGTSGEFMTRSSGLFHESRYRAVSGGRVRPQTSSYFSAQTRVGRGAQTQAHAQAQLRDDSQAKRCRCWVSQKRPPAWSRMMHPGCSSPGRGACYRRGPSKLAMLLQSQIKDVWSWCLPGDLYGVHPVCCSCPYASLTQPSPGYIKPPSHDILPAGGISARTLLEMPEPTEGSFGAPTAHET